jgi:hypothetical protein
MMNQTKDQTVLDVFKEFPGYAYDYIFGFFLAIISDITLTSLALGSFFLGYATTLWLGLAVFFLGHTVIKIVNALNSAIVQQGRLAGGGSISAGERLAKVFDTQAAGASKPNLKPPTDI